MTRFIRNESHPYTVITPDTPLAELAEFLRHNIFALGESYLMISTACLTDDDLVTDSKRKFVLAVATSQDLEVGVSPSLCVDAILSSSHRTSFLGGVYDVCVIYVTSRILICNPNTFISISFSY